MSEQPKDIVLNGTRLKRIIEALDQTMTKLYDEGVRPTVAEFIEACYELSVRQAQETHPKILIALPIKDMEVIAG